MARLSKRELAVITANPIKNKFELFLAIFKSTYPNIKVEDSPACYKNLLIDLSRYKRQIF